jgi:hypothetical protein
MPAGSRIQRHDDWKGKPRPETGEISTATQGKEEKERMDAKQLRPKADQAVSLVSAAPALVGIIDLVCKGELRASRLWSFLGLEV